MCGISGIVNLNTDLVQGTAIRAMTDRLAHRGPDAEGIYADQYVALGHRRLSIIDLSATANQPMKDHSGRYILVFNGEIYNYQEVRALLPEYPFRTHSDTEVVIAAYETWGVHSLAKLNGMFAYVIWDTHRHELFAARDRVGKKPFYYHHSDSVFAFSSEVRSLMASGLWQPTLDATKLPEFFMYQAPMYEHTLVNGIKSLPAGHYAMISKHGVSINAYWNYNHIQPSTDDAHTAKQKVRDLFLDSVRLRMVSDVPVGAFLSGGIDSSLVVACMAEQSSTPINTFNVSFNEKAYDESGYAEQIAHQYQTKHHRILVRPETFLESLDDVLGDMDSPSGDGPNTWLVSKHTKATGIKVTLSGLGGDELFVGYNKFLMYQRLQQQKWISGAPAFLKKAMTIFLTMARNSGGSKFNELSRLKQWNFAHLYPLLRRSYTLDEANGLLKFNMASDYVEKRLMQLQQSLNHFENFSLSTVGEMETYTRDVLLRDTDQMAMAHALEVRVPFFDYRLIEYVLSLPDKIKYPHTPKQLLVDALAPRLPQQISQRNKMGFTLPIHHWLHHELSSFATGRIQRLAARPEFNEQQVLQKWMSFKNGDPKVPWTRIWKLIVLSDWLERNKL